MRIVSLFLLLLKVTKQANSLKCHENEAGAEPKEVACSQPDNEFCAHVDVEGKITRRCMGKKDEKGEQIDEGCFKMPEYEAMGKKVPPMTGCFCKSDNCNNDCKAGDKCTEETRPALPPVIPVDLKFSKCNAICKTSGGDPGTDPKATEKPDDTTGGDNGEDTNATEKDDTATAGDNGEDSKATEKSDDATKISDDATVGPESGTGATTGSGCQGIINSFEKISLFWIFASLVTFIGIY